MKVEPEFDFLDFEEAKRWSMAPKASRARWSGRVADRHANGEVLALRWQDVDLVAGRSRFDRTWCAERSVRRSRARRARSRSATTTRAALKSHRHLRGPLVFCDMDGRMLTTAEMRHPRWRTCKRRAFARSAGTRCATRSRVSSRCGGPLKAVQDLLGPRRSDDDAVRPPRRRRWAAMRSACWTAEFVAAEWQQKKAN